MASIARLEIRDERCNDSAMDEVIESAVHLQVLGPVTASAGGDEIAVGGPRVRSLLAALALARGRMLSADVILADVWGDASPGVRSALRANVSRLRSTPLGPHLVGGRQGYALVPSPALEVDLWRLDDLGLEALTGLIDAAPFDGAGDAPFLRAARASARTAVRRAVVRAIDAEPGHPLARDATDRLLARSPDDPELRALRLSVAAGGRPAGGLVRGGAPASTTRKVGLPAPIAVPLPRPEDDARIAAALRLSRLVTLVGPAGAGKSRAAIEWARGLSGLTQEHIWFCRADGHGWLAELARAVGAHANVEGVVDRMSALRGTVLVDGADGADDAAGLAALLEGAPGVAALVTARRPLGIPGESVQRIGALGVADARALFRLRAGGDVGSDDEVDTVTAAVGRLPLGIELAAARAAQTPLASIVEALTASAATGSDPLDAALTATLGLLTDAEFATLTGLCIFRGPFHVESAIALGGPTVSIDLETLRAWSLLIDESLGGSPLLRVPEIVRRRLRREESSEDRARHCEWFAARTFAAFQELTTVAATATLRRLDAERSDIEAAFQSAIDVRDRAAALRIAAGMAWAGLTSGTQAATLDLARRAASVGGEARADIEACARLGHGILAYQLGFMDEAAVALAAAVQHARTTGAPDLIALAHAFVAYLATLVPDGTPAAVDGMRLAEAHLDQTSPSARAMIVLISAQVARSRGDLTAALRRADAAHALARDAGHGWVLLMSGVVAAKVRIDAREPREALVRLRTVLEDPRVRADPISVLIASSVAAGAAAGAGADDAGARIIGAVDAIGPRYAFDPRANEPADFERYRRRVREGLTAEGWRDAYTRGTALTLAELIDETVRLASRRGSAVDGR